MATALNQQQQLKNEATRMAMRVPLFYGNKKKTPWTSPDLSQLAMLWDWEITRKNAIFLEVISEVVPWQCGWTPLTKVSKSTIGEALKIQYRGKTEKTTFCHQLPKLVQDKTETISDFAERCIKEMQEFVDAMLYLPTDSSPQHTWRCQPETRLKPEVQSIE